MCFEPSPPLLIFAFQTIVMKFKLSIVTALLTLAYFGYIFFTGITNPDALGYTQMIILCVLLSVVSYFVSMGAFEDIDNERKAG
jgi:hypothetical protein